MKKYIGIKEVKAQPMAAEEALKKSYRVGDNKGDGYEVEYTDGYKSWSPKKAFEAAYQVADSPLDRMEIEKSELEVRLHKLETVLLQDAIDGIKKYGSVQYLLMREQRSYMRHYYTALCSRITNLQLSQKSAKEL